MLNTRPTTLAVQTGRRAKTVDLVHRGGRKAKGDDSGRQERPRRQTTARESCRKRNVSGRELVVRTHLFLRDVKEGRQRCGSVRMIRGPQEAIPEMDRNWDAAGSRHHAASPRSDGRGLGRPPPGFFARRQSPKSFARVIL